MKEITRNDFNLFQDEILGLIKKYDTKSTEKILELSSNIQKTDLMSEQKFENFKYNIENMLKNLESNKAIVKLNDKIVELTNKIEELKTTNNTKISNFERDLSNACFKYDKIFLNNISSPGLIGSGCPYPTMRAFLEFSNSKIKELMGMKEKFGMDFQKYHDWVKSSLDKVKEEMDITKEEISNNLKKEIKNYDKRSMDKMNVVEDKLSFIRIENGRYNYNLNKKTEELEEKLLLFYVMNDNLVKLYNKARKELLDTQKELNNIVQYLNYIKSSSPGNKVTYDKFNKRIEINKPQGINSDNVLPFINSFDEISKNIFNTSKNNNNSKGNNNKNNMKKMKLFTKKNTVNLDTMGFSFNRLNRLTKNNNLFTDISGNDNEESIKNIKSDFSERKLTKKLSTFRKSNLTVEERNELKILSKENKSEKNKKEHELHNIEEENVNKEKSDKQTSPIRCNKLQNKVFSNLIISPNKINSFTFERKELSKNNNEEKEKDDKNINTDRIGCSEEFNEIKSKFYDLYEKSNYKINIIMQHLNALINNMNKIIFNKKDNLNPLKDIENISDLKNKRLLFNNSGNKLLFPLNRSHEDKLNKTEKGKEIEKNNIPNLKKNIKINKNIIIKDTYLNENLKLNNYVKTAEIRGNSNDIVKQYEDREQKTNDYLVRMLRIKSLNKIEDFLIKKFTDDN